jgi:hypothetical protein
MSSELKSNEVGEVDEQITSTSPTYQETEISQSLDEDAANQAPESKKNKKLK